MNKSITKRLNHSLRLALPLTALLSLSACLFSVPNLVFYDYRWNADNSLNLELNRKMFSVNADGSQPQTLADLNPKQLYSPDRRLRLESNLWEIPTATWQLPSTSRDMTQTEVFSLAQTDGSGRRELVKLNQKQALQAGWSPDSRHIALLYGLLAPDNSFIETQELSILSSGSEPAQVVTPASLRGAGTRGSITAYQWTTDNTLLILLESTEASASNAGRLKPKARYEIYRLKPGSPAPVSIIPLKLTPEQGQLSRMNVAADEAHASFTDSDNKLSLADLQTGQVTYLERGNDASWSPDSKTLVFTSYEPPNYPQPDSMAYKITKTDLVKVDAKGQNRSWITRTPDLAESKPLWSPNGSWLAFQIPDHDGREKSGIYTISPDGQNRTKVTQSIQLANIPSIVP